MVKRVLCCIVLSTICKHSSLKKFVGDKVGLTVGLKLGIRLGINEGFDVAVGNNEVEGSREGEGVGGHPRQDSLEESQRVPSNISYRITWTSKLQHKVWWNDDASLKVCIKLVELSCCCCCCC